MKTRFYFTILFIVLIGPRATVSAQVTGQNLIANPSCEDSSANNKIPSWFEVSGFDWHRATGNVDGFPPAFDGQYIFGAGNTDSAELRQDVNVSMFTSSIDNGLQSFVFHGYVRSYDQTPPDSSRIILEYRSDSASTPLRVFDSRNISNPSAWQPVSDSALAPVGTRLIRIRLISTRFNGAYNDGYYDALSLIASGILLKAKNDVTSSPKEFGLNQNYPNPFNPGTIIEYRLSSTIDVDLKVYDEIGHEIRVLVNEQQTPGYHQIYFDAFGLPSGSYFCRLQAGNFVKTMKMFLVK